MATKITRRDALELLAGTAGLALGPVGLSAQNAALEFERGAVIRTLLRDVAPDDDRRTDPVPRAPLDPLPADPRMATAKAANVPASFTDDVDLMIEETKAAGRDGVACIVDGGHPDMDRDLEAVKRIATESGVHIVASGGFYMQRNYPADIASKSAIRSPTIWCATPRRSAWAPSGKSVSRAVSSPMMSARCSWRLPRRRRAPASRFSRTTPTRARVRPRANSNGHGAQATDVLEAAGANPRHLAIGHVCCLDDVKAEIPKQLAKRGVFVGFDRVTLPIVPDAQKVTTILAFLEAGHVDHLLLSSDFATGRALKKNGGPGIAQTATVFGPMLIQSGRQRSHAATHPGRQLPPLPRLRPARVRRNPCQEGSDPDQTPSLDCPVSGKFP